MSIFKGAAWAAFALTVISIVMGIGNEFPALIGAGIAVAFIGVFFLGLDRIVVLLGQIANPTPKSQAAAMPDDSPMPVPTGGPVTRSAVEIAADLRRMREGLDGQADLQR